MPTSHTKTAYNQALKAREDIAQVKHLIKEEISSLRENNAELLRIARAKLKA